MPEEAEKRSEPAVSKAKANRAPTAKVDKIDVESLPHFASVFAPAALAVGAFLYLTGHSNRVAPLRSFGVDGTALSASFQAIMANGLFLRLISAWVNVAMELILWKMSRWAQLSFDRFAQRRPSIAEK